MKKTVALLLTLAMLVPMLTAWPSLAAPDPENVSASETLFSTSFEAGEGHRLLQSQPDGDHWSNVAAYPYPKEEDDRLMSKVLPRTVEGTPDGFSGEGKINLFDGSVDTKFCIDLADINANSPVVVQFGLSVPCKVEGYRLASANDGEPRDPATWTLYASADGKAWEQIDHRSGIAFSSRKQHKSFTLAEDDRPAYSYFRIEITAVRGKDYSTKGTLLCQFSELELLGEPVKDSGSDEPVGNSPMTSIRADGPLVSSAAFTNTGFTGYSALQVNGKQSTKTDTYARNVLYSRLDIPVTADTRLSYVIYPALVSSAYDYNHTSHYLAIDLLFSDGSYLSELQAVDQNGFLLDPASQGDSEALFTMQWNYIESNIGKVAAGKRITAILVYFSMPETEKASAFLAYFDDILLENKAEVSYRHLSDYINILRGTNNTKSVSRGITVPLVTLPNGFNGYTPANTTDELLPYYYQESGNGCSLRHLTVNHTASPWVPAANWGTWQMMVNTSLDVASVNSQTQIDASHRAARYKHQGEIAKAHYYSVNFLPDDENAPSARMELTPTSHGAYTRFTYPADAEYVNLILGTEHGGSVKVSADPETGKTIVSGYSENQLKMYVYSEIDALCTDYSIQGRTVILSFPKGTEVITMKLATSYISDKQAKHNLALEIDDTDTFDSIYAKAQQEWDDICNLVVPEGATYTQLVTLYSSLYRMYCYPMLYAENTGTNGAPAWKYRSPYNDKVVEGKMYTTNGFWDTYRAEWPALTLLTPQKAGELLDGLLLHYRDGGYIARWLGRDGVKSMLGTHSDIILADAYRKNIPFDAKAAYESMLKNAAVISTSDIYGRPMNDFSIFNGYVPNTYENGMSWTVEDYINDFGIYQMAKALAEDATDPAQKAEYASVAAYYKNRALRYPQLFNDKVGFFMGRDQRGGWTKDSRAFNPYALDWYADYAETNAWNMAFPIVYDVNGLSALYGGADQLSAMLDEYFSEESETSAILGNYTYEQRETRLGMSMFNNQVCYHIPYLYNYLGQPYKAQAVTRELLSRLYVGAEIGQGYPGDEDNGASSAFYVLTALGLYEAAPGTGEYCITSPLYEKVTLNLGSGKITIVAKDNSAENIYIQSCTLNGESYTKSYFDYATLTSGDVTIVYQMGNTPSDWGTVDAAPTSLSSTVAQPEALTDLTAKAIRTETGSAQLLTPAMQTVWAQQSKSTKKLFDNSGTTSEQLQNHETLTFAFTAPTRVSLLTLTSVTKSGAPKSVQVEYSADGQNWISLGSHTTGFRWGQETLPVALPEMESACYFLRLTLDGDGSTLKLAEIELLGKADSASTLPPVTKLPTDPAEPTDPSTPTDPDASDDASDQLPLVLIIAVVAIASAAVGGGAVLLILRKRK